MLKYIGNDWDGILEDEFRKDYFKSLEAFVAEERSNYEVYPPEKDVFNALRYTPLEDVRVVILGQDPYHEPGQSHGLAFSVPEGVKRPPSLVNIMKEMASDLGEDVGKNTDSGNLEKWARSGVLLLNAVLTVRAHKANSHKKKGWEKFTDAVIKSVAEKEEPVVFILWGAKAAAKSALVTNPNHFIIRGPHPSPLSAYRGFFGGCYFSKTNEYLEKKGIKPIDWIV